MMLPELTTEERELLGNRKSPDATHRDGLRVMEIQTRVWLTQVKDEAKVEGFTQECAALKERVIAATTEQMAEVARELFALHQRVLEATRG